MNILPQLQPETQPRLAGELWQRSAELCELSDWILQSMAEGDQLADDILIAASIRAAVIAADLRRTLETLEPSEIGADPAALL